MISKPEAPGRMTELEKTDDNRAEVLRFSYYHPRQVSDLPTNAAREYSRMKYGDPEPTHSIAGKLTDLLLNSSEFQSTFPVDQPLLIASSAYGSIPTAAHALTAEMSALLEQEGYRIQPIKIERSGGFARTDYGALTYEQRLEALRSRRLSISPEDIALLKGQNLLVVDDLRSSGAHEKVLLELLRDETEVKEVAFAYWIAFASQLQEEDPMQEESINHSDIYQLEDLLTFFQDSMVEPYLNARVLKFILQGGLDEQGDMAGFFRAIPVATCMRIYLAALSRDGYCTEEKFARGIRLLEDHLLATGPLMGRNSILTRNRAEGRIVLHDLAVDAAGDFRSLIGGEEVNDLIARYSRFKFGDVGQIRWFAEELTSWMIYDLEKGNRLMETFERAKERGEYIYLQAPGYRNVVSASNYLLQEVAASVNVWLTRQGLPTMIVRPIARLASGRANYAELPADERDARRKTTKSLIPASDYQDQPIHVIFLDDVEVTGTTSQRARRKCLDAGALSFHSIFIFRVDPQIAQEQAGIEHVLNQYTVKGQLDEVVAEILAHPDYQPVQRMLRLLLHPDNREALPSFARHHIPPANLLRIYLGAMNNDYLWINADAPGELGLYGVSLELLGEMMKEEGLLDEQGIPIFPREEFNP